MATPSTTGAEKVAHDDDDDGGVDGTHGETRHKPPAIDSIPWRGVGGAPAAADVKFKCTSRPFLVRLSLSLASSCATSSSSSSCATAAARIRQRRRPA